MSAAMTLKNIPDDIYDRLKASATAHHRSINMEAIACLEQVLLPTRTTAEERLAQARQVRRALNPGKFKAREIDRAIRAGRP